MPHKRLLLTLAFGIVPLFPLPASALGIGEIISQPRLGERLRIEVRLISGSDERIEPGCLELSQGDASDDLPWVRGARVRIENGPRPKAIIESNEVVNNPIYLLGLKAVCDGALSREFTLMPQAPIEFSGSPATGTAPRDSGERQKQTAGLSSRADQPAPTPADRLSQEALRTKSESTPKRTKKAKPPFAAPDSSRNVATRPASPADRAPANPAPADRLVVAGGGSGEPNLRFSTQLDDSRSRGLTEAQREQLRQEQRLVAELDEKIVSSLALAEKIRNMEGYLEKLQADMAQLDHNIQTAKNGTAAPATPAPGTAPSAGSEAKSAVPAPAAESEWPLYAAGAAAGLMVIGGLLWQRRRRGETDQGDVQFDEPAVDETVEAQGEESTEGAHDVIELDKPLDLRLSEQPLDENAHISVAEHDSALELAEIMLSFGRVQGAAQTLSDYIASNPRQSIKPWLKLLGIYREAGMQTEFIELATRMHQTFNVRPIGWDDFAGPASRTSIEDLQHLIEPIVAHWRTRPCLEYLRHLLLDNREGTRGGFSLGVADDISVLVAVLETELFPHPSAT